MMLLFSLSLSLLFTAENSPFPFFSCGKYGRTFARYSSQLICFHDKQYISYPSDNKPLFRKNLFEQDSTYHIFPLGDIFLQQQRVPFSPSEGIIK